MQIHQDFLELDGLRIYYETAGSGHPLVLIHGFSLDTRMWDDQFENFAQHYRVIRYDIRGYGKSSTPTSEPYSHAGDLKALLDHLDISQAHILGLSLGGAIAINFTLAYPHMVRALVLADSVLWGHSWVETETGAIWQASREQGIEEARKLWLAHSMFAAARDNPHVATALTRIVSDYSGWHWVNDDPGAYPDPPDSQFLSRIRVPALVLVGARDIPDFQVIADTLAQTLPNAQKVLLSGVGHMCNMEDPAGFNDAVLGFLRAVR